MNYSFKLKSGAIKLLKENREEKPYDVGLGDDFLHVKLKAQATKAKNKHMKLHQMKLILCF